MLIFLDFEASSLGKHSYPIEVAWIGEDDRSESYLIRPADAWTDWDPASEAIHGIARQTLFREGVPADQVAARMINALSGHDLLASAPSWDGKWLSTLLRAAGLPRHSLRLRDSDDACRELATAILVQALPSAELAPQVERLLAETESAGMGATPAHRALPDAQAELARWRAIGDAARALAANHAPR
jgi:hypothetical protein